MATFDVEVIYTSTVTHTVEAQSITEASEAAIELARINRPDTVEYIIGDVKVLTGGSLA